jgi:hypothetical protein
VKDFFDRKALLCGILIAGFLGAGLVILMTRTDSRSDDGMESVREISAEKIPLDSDGDPVTQESTEDDSEIPIKSDPASEHTETTNRITIGIAPEDPFHAQILTIAGLSHSLGERLSAIQSLSHPLNESEIEALYRFLLAPPPDRRAARLHDRAVKNEVLNLVRAEVEDPELLTSTMIAMFEDPDQDEAVRDYALQHLRSWYPHAPIEHRSRIGETLSLGLTERENSMAGTSLLSLHSLEKQDGQTVEEIDVTSEALRILESGDASVRSQVTAMQVAAERASGQTIDIASKWAVDPDAGYPRRLSGIAALGRSGARNALDILRNIESENDPYLQPAIDNAYAHLKQVGVE